MNREGYTLRVALLIQYVPLICKYRPILDYAKRTTPGQAYLFSLGLSRCDGRRRRSRHQVGKAFDVLLTDGKKLHWPRKVYVKLHKFWELLGGRPMLSWDIGHFA